MADSAAMAALGRLGGSGTWRGYGLATLRELLEYYRAESAIARCESDGSGRCAYFDALADTLGAEIGRRQRAVGSFFPAPRAFDVAFARDLKDRIPLGLLLANDGVLLKRSGMDRCVGLCPAHCEKTPSFVVYDDGHYHCFGCKASGDHYDWLMRGGCSFPEAVERLATWWGVPMPNPERPWKVEL